MVKHSIVWLTIYSIVIALASIGRSTGWILQGMLTVSVTGQGDWKFHGWTDGILDCELHTIGGCPTGALDLQSMTAEF